MKYLTITAFLLFNMSLFSQTIQLPENSIFHHFADRMSVLHQIDVSNAIRPYDAEQVKNNTFGIYQELSENDKNIFNNLINQYNLKKLEFLKYEQGEQKIQVDSLFYKYEPSSRPEVQDDLWYQEQKPVLKYFYKNPHHFLSIDVENFSLRANPIVKLEYGKSTNHTETIFQNTRGAELSAMIDNKIFIFTRILENQQSFQPYANQYINRYKAIPQNGFYKNYNSSVIGNLNGYDFLNTVAYVTAPISKSIGVELGHGNHFYGNGYRSLLLSNFSNNYFYLKFNTKIWKLHYRNIFAELSAESANFSPGDLLLDKKYMANHYLSIRPGKNFEIGIFECVVFNRTNQFELQYLNPVIFYRTVEQFIGSPDNALIGLNSNLNLLNKIQLYGQLMLDEFNLGLFKQDGWWGNKFGFQGGLKYFNLLNIDQLDFLIEYNTVRPYTYSHDKSGPNNLSLSSYAHYNLPLAHPLGANFKELITNVKYNGIKNLMVDATLSYMQIGRDRDSLNYGQDIMLNNTTRVSDFGNHTLQGEINNVLFLQLNASYEILTNYKVFLNSSLRNSTSKNNAYNYNNFYLGGGIMINMNFEKNIF